jgi:hypothetical protein
MGLFGKEKDVKTGPTAGQAAPGSVPQMQMDIIPQITIGMEKGTGRNVFICNVDPVDAVKIMAGAIQGLAAKLKKDPGTSIVMPPPGAKIVDPTKG